jgi:hypothetical protein
MNVVWGVDSESGESLGPRDEKKGGDMRAARFSSDPLQQVGPAGSLSIRKLMDWISGIRLDPNDPRNQSLFRLKQLVTQTFNGVLPSELIPIGDGGVEHQVLKNLPFHV